MKVYILVETFFNDGITETTILDVAKKKELLNSSIDNQLEEYKGYDVFNDINFNNITKDENKVFIKSDCGNYYCELSIIEKKVIS